MERIPISVVIPTCNRKARLLSLLQNLDNSTYPIDEVIIVDSGDDKLLPSEYSIFKNLVVQYIESERSVCIQRNIGVRIAKSSWIFLCDDDIELPSDYLQILTIHINSHPDAGAVSGSWLQKEKGEPIAIGWKATYPVHSTKALLWKYFFQLDIWGEINVRADMLTRKIKKYYRGKGNHISKAGWPVLTDFSGEYFIAPVYSLGASLVRKDWLIHSPFEEVLDRNGIGDNYGVIVDFPVPEIHVINSTFVYHHREPRNRLKRSLQYYRRTLALYYFIKTKSRLKHIKKIRLIWSLVGNLFGFLYAGEFSMVKAGLKSILKITFNKNPYFKGNKRNIKVIEPKL